MILNHLSQLDASLEPTEIMNLPAGFTWPRGLAKFVDAHESAWNAWSTAELAQLEAADRYNEAGERDKALLIAAVTNGAPDPGTPNQEAATRGAIYAEEGARQAARRYNLSLLALRAELPKHRDTLTAQAVKIEREAIAEYAGAIAQAQAIVDRATPVGNAVGSRANWLSRELGEPAAHHISSATDQIAWPAPWRIEQHVAATVLDLIESSIGQTSPETTSATDTPV